MSTRLTQRFIAKTASYTIRPASDAPGTRFSNRGATGTITFTLPAPAQRLKGFWYGFEIQADYTLIVAGATAGDLATLGNAAANNVSYAIASNKLGRRIFAECDGTQWFCYGIGEAFCVNGVQITPTIAEIASVIGLVISATELGFIDGITAGSITASKAVTRDAGLRIPFATASPAAAGNSAGTSTAITADVNLVTAADGTKGVILPVGVAGMRMEVVNTVVTAAALLKVYPDTGGQINAAGANVAFSVAPGARAIFVCTAALTWQVAPNDAQFALAGVAARYRLARGVHTQVAASDTVVTGLTTVVAVVVSPKTVTVKQLFFQGDIGNQAGAPAAGSILITSKKPTAVNDVTPTAATDFTENIDVHWVAIGT